MYFNTVETLWILIMERLKKTFKNLWSYKKSGFKFKVRNET